MPIPKIPTPSGSRTTSNSDSRLQTSPPSSRQATMDDRQGTHRGVSMDVSSIGSFMAREPVFESEPSSSEAGDEAPDNGIRSHRLPVRVVWRNLTVVTREGWRGQKKVLLNHVDGYVEPRTVLAIVGPARSGKTAFMAVLAGMMRHPARVTTGELLVNGCRPEKSPIWPTVFCLYHEILTHLTVEQSLIYTALLQMKDSKRGNIEQEVLGLAKQLGLGRELKRLTHTLTEGQKRRLVVATQLLNCSPLLVMHDILEGIPEGDCLAIMRAIHSHAQAGCTAVVQCQQPTTDMCSFFTHAYVLYRGDLVYFGEAGREAVTLLSAAALPCPALYSPVEQMMRLIDPSFEVYLQVAQDVEREGQVKEETGNTQFSSMMVSVLRDTYVNSPGARDAGDRLAQLVQQTKDTLVSPKTSPNLAPGGNGLPAGNGTAKISPSGPPPSKGITNRPERSVSALMQLWVLCQRLVSQGLRCFPFYLGRIIFTLLLVLVYGGSYVSLGSSYHAAEERTTIFFLLSCVLPMLALQALPIYTNHVAVFMREHDRCRLGIMTDVTALFLLIVPHLMVAAVIAAIVTIPMCNLNSTSSGWGYLIVNVLLVQLCADGMVLSIAAIFRDKATQVFVGLALFLVQILASGFFPGANLGIQLVFGTVSFPAWSYRGLVRNEFSDNSYWRCMGAGAVPGVQVNCRLSAHQVWALLTDGQGLQPDSKWDAIYILLGIYGFWMLLFTLAMAALVLMRPGRYR